MPDPEPDKRPPSGEIQVLILDLLREQRTDTKALTASATQTAVAVAAIHGKLEVGEAKFDEHDRRIKALEREKKSDEDSGTDYRPSTTKRRQAEVATETIRRTRQVAGLDLATMIKVGALIGAVVAGVMGGKALP